MLAPRLGLWYNPGVRSDAAAAVLVCWQGSAWAASRPANYGGDTMAATAWRSDLAGHHMVPHHRVLSATDGPFVPVPLGLPQTLVTKASSRLRGSESRCAVGVLHGPDVLSRPHGPRILGLLDCQTSGCALFESRSAGSVKGGLGPQCLCRAASPLGPVRNT
jgi:hypothetical protein